MGAIMHLFFLLPMAFCQSHMVSEKCKTNSCVGQVFYQFQERIENMQNKLAAKEGQLQGKERELQDTKTQLRVCREQEIIEPQTTIVSISDLPTYGPTNETLEKNELQTTPQSISDLPTYGQINKIPEVTVDYSTLHQYNYQAVYSVQVESGAGRLSAQGTELWCTTYSTLSVYSQSFLRTVPLEGVRNAQAVTPLPNGQLVVAEWHGGLHVLHANGSRVQSLHTEGDFSEVVSVQGGFLALRDRYPTWHNSTMYSYNITSGEIQYSGNITLPHRAQRMSVFNDTVYLTHWWTPTLYKYSISGQMLGRHGQQGRDERGTSQPGLLYIPYVCSNDQQGNVLVADSDNYRMQVWSPKEDRWTVIPLDGDSGQPQDAVVSADGTTMWVMEGKFELGWSNFIVTYTKQ